MQGGHVCGALRARIRRGAHQRERAERGDAARHVAPRAAVLEAVVVEVGRLTHRVRDHAPPPTQCAPPVLLEGVQRLEAALPCICMYFYIYIYTYAHIYAYAYVHIYVKCVSSLWRRASSHSKVTKALRVSHASVSSALPSSVSLTWSRVALSKGSGKRVGLRAGEGGLRPAAQRA